MYDGVDGYWEAPVHKFGKKILRLRLQVLLEKDCMAGRFGNKRMPARYDVLGMAMRYD